ncbi:MAG: DUF4139 domain-containing protein [Alphaproteobacteria bacterium]|nr:DUF4139 domain-containing protein [Alphaproteobacteria bacterium]
MRIPILTAVAVLALASGGVASADEKRVGAADRAALSLTVYQGDLALVRDRRAVALDAGTNALAFEGVSARLMPPSAILVPAEAGPALRLVEQRFDFDLATPDNLLARALGETVFIARTHPQTGERRFEPARLITVENGLAVLEAEGRVVVEPAETLAFAGLPAGLRARPTLLAVVDSEAAGPRALDLSYLTGGVTWQADWVARLHPDETAMSLEARVTLTNTSGAAYPEARLHLVAGEVRRAPEPAPERMVTMAMKAAPAMDDGIATQPLEGFHLYTVARPVTLGDNQSKQIALLAAPSVAVERRLLSEGEIHLFRRRVGDDWPAQKAKVQLRFRNDEASGLGVPLPAGTLRAYRPDAAGVTHFVGEAPLGHTARGEEVTLTLGEDFDVSVERAQKSYAQIAPAVWESGWEITLRNGKPGPVTVELREPMAGDWTILEETAPHRAKDSGTAVWTLPVPPGGQTVLRYRVRVKN